MKLVINKMPCSAVILPQNATPRERLAGEEVAAYVKKISDAVLPVLTVGDPIPSGGKILIGAPDRNPLAKELIGEEEFYEKVPGGEGFLILSQGETLLLAGNSRDELAQQRGTLYAVYELFERYFGCSFAVFSKHGTNAGEWVPAADSLLLEDGEYVMPSADLPYRAAIVQYDVWVGNPDHALNDLFLSWLAKNRFNRIVTWTGIYEGLKKSGMIEEAEKRGIRFSVGHHQAFTMLIPPYGSEYFPEKYAETHPEYFRLLEDGTRYVYHDGDYLGQITLCMRDPGLIETMTNNILEWSDKNPQVDVICLWPHDGCAPQCCCEKCQKHTKNINYTYFVSEVARRVAKVKPWLMLDRIGYADLLEYETDVEPGQQMGDALPPMIVHEAVWHGDIGMRYVGKPDGSCITGTVYEDVLFSWKDAGAAVVYYDYLMGNYGCRQKWLPTADEMQAIYKRMADVGIMGIGSQLECFNVWNHAFNFYSMGRTTYDNSLSMEDNLARFCVIFGKGAPFIKDIIRYGEAVLDGQAKTDSAPAYLMNHIDREHVYRLYDLALDAADTPTARNNVRLMRMVFRYSDLDVNNPKGKKLEPSGCFTDVSDDSGELWYMADNFSSYKNGKEGYAIAIPALKQCDAEFSPDKWYIFD